jgi:uncharacterized protein (TIGR00290 family)
METNCGNGVEGAYLAAWSGGKDSCLALSRALGRGLGVSHLMHFIREPDLHAVPPELVGLQASLAGLGIVQTAVPEGGFEPHFKHTVRGAAVPGLAGIVFGDIFLREHREWIERVCGELGLAPSFPLWGEDTVGLSWEFLDMGFESIIVSARADLVDKRWVGRTFDREFIGYLTDRGLDPCGENGEFHTFVTTGPLFRQAISIKGGPVSLSHGHWFLDIEEYNVI